MELTIRSLEDVRDIHDEDGVIEEKEARDYVGELSYPLQPRVALLRPDKGDMLISYLS